MTINPPTFRYASRSCVLLLACLIVPGAWAEDFYVSANGSDENPGTEAKPLASLTRARDVIRAKRSSGAKGEPVTVYVRQGVYTLPDTLQFGKEDSGTVTAPIVYRAYENERPVLRGGRSIEGFTPFRGEILKADAASLGTAGAGARVLVFDGMRQELARYPNDNPHAPGGGDWAYVDGTPYSMYADSPDEDDYLAKHGNLDFWQRNIPRLTHTLCAKPGDVRQWQQPELGEVSIFPRFNWEHFLLKVRSVHPATRQLQLEPGCFYEIRPGDRYFVRGLFEELDSPREWYLDRQAGVLYFWPPSPIDSKPTYLAELDHLVKLEGCEYVTVRGFTLECSNGTAVLLRDCTGCVVAGNTIRNAGDHDGCGVTVEGGRENGVVGNDISHVGSDGVHVAAGDSIRLMRSEVRIDNNYIHHVGRVDRSAKGVGLALAPGGDRSVGACAGVHITHNLIHDTPQSGIFLWGSGHAVEYNRIRHTCTESEDTGAIGGGAIDWLGWLDTVIRYNFIHDTLGYGYNSQTGRWISPYFTAALYPDWAASGVTIVGNVLVRAPRTCLLIHSGRDNVIENNILVDGGQSQTYWRGWTTEEGFWSTMVDGWTRNYELAIQHPAWRKIATLRDPRRVPLADHRVMTGNVFRRNILSYSDPSSALFKMEGVPWEHNQSDFNLIHHAGHPLHTGVVVARKDIGRNLVPNPGLEEGEIGGSPSSWGIGVFPDGGAKVRVVTGQSHEGACAAFIEPARAAAKMENAEKVYLTLGAVPYRPRTAYRLSVWMKSDGAVTPVELSVFSWKKDQHSWQIQSTAALTGQWRRYELAFRLPGDGDPQYAATMDTLMWRISFVRGAESFWLDDIALSEAELADEWQSWQAQGMDLHSIVADPLFVDPAHDDYRLQPQSPALQLGFEPIPFEKIGPYQDDLRASWPIVEAQGVRETLAGR